MVGKGSLSSRFSNLAQADMIIKHQSFAFVRPFLSHVLAIALT